jgi:hypothetical protein
MKFDTQTKAILDSELAYIKILEETEFRSNGAFLKDVPEELFPSAWIGHNPLAEIAEEPVK